ncbi:helicase-exonuclease AddAB subunit AddA [Anoxybacterium hadale]|uniref:Helicase-exonuclease AddAB subunit AddA n=1 Tax=Anoxybacterium hadale TaxID=3408580 RepID=A0ACD1A7I9_9FIRM|nr:helicase-exonuclease AddAB subunit AddA [Clostridiales bacterium]
MKWTKEQQEAIEIRNKNILVSAAAGSGKTAVLVERIKQLILGDQTALDRMLIVTFSNAAASEMREKIVTAISAELEETSKEQSAASKAAFLREQLNLIHRANISTFHAFAMEVIRRYFYLIDIEPNFKICDEAQKTILQAEAMEQLFSNRFEASSQDFLQFLNQFASTKSDNGVKDMIYEAHSFIQSIPDSFSWLRAKAEELCVSRERFEESAAFAEIRKDIKRNLTLAEGCFLRAGELIETQGVSSLVPKNKLELGSIAELCEHFETLSFDEFGILISGTKFQTYTAAKAEKESYEEIKEAVSALRDQGKSLVKKLISQYFARPLESFTEDLAKTCDDARFLCGLVEEFDSLYKERKRKKSLIDFNDIEHYALAVLSREEAAAEYRQKFDYIFIDEYQDSNIVQETLIGKIKRDNNLFMVGDVKQSIYKFRLAEPEIFIGKYEAFKTAENETDIKLDLNKNFRSKKNIIASVNDIFRQIMSKDLAGLEYDDAAALYQGSPYDGDLNYPVDLYLVDESQVDDGSLDEEIREMKKAEIEAYAAAQIISEAKGSLIYDGKKGIERPLENRDIVILLRGAKGYADIYYEALLQEGIPSFIDTSDGYFDTMEIEVFLNLLRVIDNGKQDIPLLSILRSPVFGFTMEELILIRLCNKKGAYHQVFREFAAFGEQYESWSEAANVSEPEALSLAKKCKEAVDRIKSWKQQATFMPLEDFLWMLIRETGYYEYIGGIPGGGQRQANLRALVDKAVQFQSSQIKGLFSFINYIEAIRKRKVPMGQVKLLGENDDVVRIMTIHKSKGLEFPMVLTGGLGKRFNRDSDTYQISLHKDIGLGLRYVDKENSCYKKTIIQTVIDQRKRRESLAEELRILYVAFTRAMDKLVLLGTVKDLETAMDAYDLKGTDFSGARSYLDFLVPALPQSKINLCTMNRGDISLKKVESGQQKEAIRKWILGEREIVNDQTVKEESASQSGDDKKINQSGAEEKISQFGAEKKTKQPMAGEINRQNIAEEINRRFGFVYVHKNALTLKSKFTVSEISRLSMSGKGLEHEEWKIASLEPKELETTGRRRNTFSVPALETPKFIRGTKRFTAAERGTILHKVMEHLDFHGMSPYAHSSAGKVDLQGMEAAVQTKVRELVSKEILMEEEGKVVSVSQIASFFCSEIGLRAAKADKLYKEESFNVIKEISGEKIIIQGTIDCYFEEDGKYILLDYKSNYIRRDEEETDLDQVRETYRTQIELYKEALEKIRGIKVHEAYLYLFSLGRELRVL